MRFILCLVALLTMYFANGARAQIIYEPVQYQYGEQNRYYYGGSNPGVIARAEAPIDASGEWGRVHGWAFISGDTRVHREVTNETVRVYSDAVPFQNAALFGYTISDARNAAYASMPRYFRKADILAFAKATPGVLIVPAQATTPDVVLTPTAAAAPHATLPRPLMILPKPRPTTAPSDKLADASH